MFNFMKKAAEKDDKEKRKREKKERKDVKKRDRSSMSAEELLRLDEVRRSLKIPGRRKEKEKLPSGITADYSASFFAHLDRDLLDAAQNASLGPGSTIGAGTSSSWTTRTPDGLTQSDSSEASLTSLTTTTTTSSTTTSHAGKNLPPLPPKPPKRGILKGPRLNVNSGTVSVLSEEHALPNGTETSYQEASNLLVRNTLQNEVIAYQNVPAHLNNILNKDEICSEEETVCQTTWRVTTSQQIVQQQYPQQQQQQQHHQIDAKLLQVVTSASPSADSLTDTTNSSFATPPFSLSPVGESQGFSRWRSSVSFEEQGIELQLPEIVPLELPEPRELTIQRQPPPRNDFGFSLRRAVIVERTANGVTQMRPVIFAEPGALVQHNNDTGLLPGDRLIEVNGINVDDKSREEIIDLIKSSANSVTVKVQPVAELSELSRRGCDGRQVELAPANIRGGTLRRSGSLRFHQNTSNVNASADKAPIFLKKRAITLKAPEAMHL
ncbi:Myosin-XVIIIa [Ooceraea biroi]|uniref:Myosin-XVIIIa n=1 Tax=Ooceraea biroi TaxID=2015173 RepID=A0A026WPD5_OOCBI|nr:Myosin-XVIIIa [Ooceraea biroi]